jgi:hypothetical protein
MEINASKSEKNVYYKSNTEKITLWMGGCKEGQVEETE